MFIKKATYDLQLDDKYSEKITSLTMKDNELYVGREDGVLESYKNSLSYQYEGFKVEFDYLENEDIKEKIVAIEKMTDGGINDIVYIANEKVLKVLKVRNESSNLEICNNCLSKGYKVTEIQRFSNIHSYVISSLSLSANSEYLLSSDYLRIGLWRPSRMENLFTLLDLKSQLADGSLSVINTSKFSPFHDNLFGYSSSNGKLMLHDLNIHPKSQRIATFKNPIFDGIKSISDFSFVDSNLIVSRSLNNVALFDIRNDKGSVFSKDLVEDDNEQSLLNSSEAIYEKFKISNDGFFAYTGSFFSSVYSLNLLSGDIEEIIVGPSKEFNAINKTKHLVSTKDGFACSFNGSILRFEREFLK